jgi:hypothetical protein
MPRKYIVVAIALFLLSGVVVAQQLPDAPSVIVGRFPPTPGFSTTRSTTPPVAAIAPVIEPTVADVTYWISTSALVGTTFVNVEITARCAEQHTCLTQIAPSSTRLKLYAYTLPTDLLVSYLSYKLKSKTRWWIVPQVILTGANLFSAGRSYGRIQ